MAAIAQDVFDRSRILLKDKASVLANIRHPDAELCLWLTDGLASLISIHPEAATKTITIKLGPGSRQTMPLDARLVAILHNVDGPPIRRVDKYSLDSAQPGWQQQKDSNVIYEYTAKKESPRVFYVNPPSKDGVRVIAEAVIIPKITAGTDLIVVPDTYLPSLANYVCYRMHSVDAEHQANMVLASGFLKIFQNDIGLDMQADDRVNPKEADDAK